MKVRNRNTYFPNILKFVVQYFPFPPNYQHSVQLDSLDRIQECPEETNGSNTQATEEFVRKWKKREKDDCSGEFQHPEGNARVQV